MKKFEINNLERLSVLAYLNELKGIKMCILNSLEQISIKNLNTQQQIGMIRSEIRALDKDIEHFTNMSTKLIEEV